MGELLLETVFEIIFGVIRFLFELPGELAIMKAGEWGFPVQRFKGLLAILVSVSFWSIVGLSIYLLTRAFA